MLVFYTIYYLKALVSGRKPLNYVLNPHDRGVKFKINFQNHFFFKKKLIK